jgi:large subunit ribosomal protein L21
LIESHLTLVRRTDIYAVVETGGKQYRVSPGETIDVEKLAVEGDSVELDRVHLVVDGDKVSVGRPVVQGAKVVAGVVEQQGKGAKVIVFKYKPKVRYRVMRGHRQPFTRLVIKEIVVGKGKGK